MRRYRLDFYFNFKLRDMVFKKSTLYYFASLELFIKNVVTQITKSISQFIRIKAVNGSNFDSDPI